MLEICAGFYLILIVLAALFLWSSFRAAQRTDRVWYRTGPGTVLAASRRARHIQPDLDA